MSLLSPKKDHSLRTAVLVLEDGTIFKGFGFGREGVTVGELCFNTSMTGYQEILTDPSYAAQLITFTFPHIGNVGVNDEDIESLKPAARGLIVREDVTEPSNYRANKHLDEWLKFHDLVGICGVDTRAITRLIRDKGAQNAVLCYSSSGEFDEKALLKKARDWAGLEGMDLAKEVTCKEPYEWAELRWDRVHGYRELANSDFHVVAIDYGMKRNILRSLASAGCRVTVVPATTSADDILAYKPDGIFLSNGPGDPAATGAYAVPVIKELVASGLPVFGICLGHQMLAIALGARTEKLKNGHRGGNHPVKDNTTGKVEITSQNHGFAVVRESLPKQVMETHVSLFDGTNEGIKLDKDPVFSVQYHPEASPGPHDSHYLFKRFIEFIRLTKELKKKYA